MAESDDWLGVGKIVGVQGLQGELRVNPASDFPERFTAPGPRWLRSRKGGEPTEIQLKKGRQLPGKSLFVVRLEGIDSRSAAEALVGQELLVSADDRPELDEGEFHLLDLLEITTAEGRKLLIPFVQAIVPEVQLEEGWLLLTPPPGLLEL